MKKTDHPGKSSAYLLGKLSAEEYLSDEEAHQLINISDTQQLIQLARLKRDRAHGTIISYSKKVFIPLTQLCRDVCHYCTFAQSPKKIPQPYLPIDEVIKIAKAGEKTGCTEALFTLGEKPELRYAEARDWLDQHHYQTTLEYLADAAKSVLAETTLLPHLNPGCMTTDELAALRPVSASMGIMLESAAERLCEKGGPHYGSPDKNPAIRLATIEAAGKLQIPFTSGILIGIGETRSERIESLLRLREIHARYGHLQEVIIQNFRAKPGTGMARAPMPDHDDLLWTIAVARLIFSAEMNIQVPPNLNPDMLQSLLDAGINDWGGVSPLTPDFVNPEAPWPHLEDLADETQRAGKQLVQRATAYPAYAQAPDQWFDEAIYPAVLRSTDSTGYSRDDLWAPGSTEHTPNAELMKQSNQAIVSPYISTLLEKLAGEKEIGEKEIVSLFSARGDDVAAICQAADQLREKVSGPVVRYVVNRNINYTNICYFHCQFCAFAKGKQNASLRGEAYNLDLPEIVRRSQEAWDRGATEVCLQGGIHPRFTGQTYIDICAAIKAAIPAMHIHAFSPLEIWQGAKTLGIDKSELLQRLKEAGLDTLPGTAAEILDDDIRSIICADKIDTQQWLDVIAAAHEHGLNTTSTIMFGHIEQPVHWARHLLRIKQLQIDSLASRAGRITEFVPLPYVPAEAPMFLKGRSRSGPTFRETLLMHAIARLVLHPHITNIQTSWAKLGEAGIAACLQAGANDMGGTLMNESISRAAGADFGQELPPSAMEKIIQSIGRKPQQRTTLYEPVPEAKQKKAWQAAELTPIINQSNIKLDKLGRSVKNSG